MIHDRFINCRMCLPLITWAFYVVVFLLSPTVHAEESVASFGPSRQFEDFPKGENIGDRGHLMRVSFFTGKWLCVPISAGRIAAASNTPFTAHAIPVSDERFVAIVAINYQTGEKLCIDIAPQWQPLWMGSEFFFQVLSQDTICFTTRKGGDLNQPDDCYVLTIFLSEKRISKKFQNASRVKEQLDAWAIDPLAASGNAEIENVLMRELQVAGTSFLSSEAEYGRGIGLLDPQKARYLGAGANSGRILEFDRIGDSRLKLSEREVMSNRHVFWELTEAALEQGSDRSKVAAKSVFFSRQPIAPIRVFVIGIYWTNNKYGLVAIVDGKVSQVWNVPDEYRLFRLHVSEDETHAGVALANKGDGPLRRHNLSINVITREITVSSSSEDVGLVGVGNSGELIEASGYEFFVESKSGARRLIDRPIGKPR